MQNNKLSALLLILTLATGASAVKNYVSTTGLVSTMSNTEMHESSDDEENENEDQDNDQDKSTRDSAMCKEMLNKLTSLKGSGDNTAFAKMSKEYRSKCREYILRGGDEDESSDDTQKIHLYVKEDAECKELRGKIVQMHQDGNTDSDAFLDLRASFTEECGVRKMLPPAGFKDRVLKSVESYNNPFPDTDTRTELGQAASEMYRRGVVEGSPEGDFKPQDPVSRAQAAKILLLACNRKAVANGVVKQFRDTEKGAWYENYVNAAAEQGVIEGTPEGDFKPADEVNRAEFAKMLMRGCKVELKELKSSLKDVPADAWFAQYAPFVEKYRLYDGIENGEMKPGAKLTRDEVVRAIYRYLKARDAEANTVAE